MTADPWKRIRACVLEYRIQYNRIIPREIFKQSSSSLWTTDRMYSWHIGFTPIFHLLVTFPWSYEHSPSPFLSSPKLWNLSDSPHSFNSQPEPEDLLSWGQDTSQLQLNGQKTQQTHKRNETNEVCVATGTLHKHVAPVERKEGRPADWSIWQSKGAVLSRLTWHFLQRWRQPVHLPEEPEEAEGKDKTEGIRGNKRESLGVDKVLWKNKVILLPLAFDKLP